MMVGAMNPCPCGFFGDTTKECRCTGAIIQRYLGKISGPLLDRIDLHMEVPAVAYKELRSNARWSLVRRDAGASRQLREPCSNGEASTMRIFRIVSFGSFARWMRRANARSRWRCGGWAFRPGARPDSESRSNGRRPGPVGKRFSETCRRSRAISQPGSELLG